MNDYINAQIQQMKAYVKTFESACVLAAKKTDGIVDKAEEKTLKKIQKAVEHFTRELDKA